MKCALRTCNNDATHLKVIVRSGGEKYRLMYCKKHAPQGSIDLSKKRLTCGHPITCLGGENRGYSSTHYCSCCYEEEKNARTNVSEKE